LRVFPFFPYGKSFIFAILQKFKKRLVKYDQKGVIGGTFADVIKDLVNYTLNDIAKKKTPAKGINERHSPISCFRIYRNNAPIFNSCHASSAGKSRFRPSSKTHEEMLKETETIEKRIQDRELRDIMDDYDRYEEYRRIHGMNGED